MKWPAQTHIRATAVWTDSYDSTATQLNFRLFRTLTHNYMYGCCWCWTSRHCRRSTRGTGERTPTWSAKINLFNRVPRRTTRSVRPIFFLVTSTRIYSQTIALRKFRCPSFRYSQPSLAARRWLLNSVQHVFDCGLRFISTSPAVRPRRARGRWIGSLCHWLFEHRVWIEGVMQPPCRGFRGRVRKIKQKQQQDNTRVGRFFSWSECSPWIRHLTHNCSTPWTTTLRCPYQITNKYIFTHEFFFRSTSHFCQDECWWRKNPTALCRRNRACWLSLRFLWSCSHPDYFSITILISSAAVSPLMSRPFGGFARWRLFPPRRPKIELHQRVRVTKNEERTKKPKPEFGEEKAFNHRNTGWPTIPRVACSSGHTYTHRRRHFFPPIPLTVTQSQLVGRRLAKTNAERVKKTTTLLY